MIASGRCLWISIALAAPMCAASFSRACAHAELERADPRVGSKVATAPKELVLQFSQDLILEQTSVEVRDVSGARVDKGDLTTSPEDHARAKLSLRALAPGEYHVYWRAVTDDAATLGRFIFTIEPSLR